MTRRVAHLTTVDSSLRYLLAPQLQAAIDSGDDVIGISAPGPDVAWLESRGVRHRALRSSTRGMDLLADLRAAGQLLRILRAEQPDVLHTHNPKPGVYGRIVGRLAGVPLVVNTVHGLYATDTDPWSRRAVVYGLEAVASRFSHVELVQNPEDLELLARHRLAPRKKLRLLGNGVDLVRFDPDRVEQGARAEVRGELGIADDEIVVGSVGRLVAEKGYPELFAALRRLGPPFVGVVIGPHDPDKRDALPDEVLDRATADGVRLLGHREDVERLYAAMDLFVLPSHREGFPRAAMEATAMGIPVIASDIRGCRQVVADGVTGLLVPARDVDALADAIQRLGLDPSRRTEMAAAATARARAQFDERRVVQIVMGTYDSAQPSARRRPFSDAVKRALDVTIAGVGLVLLAPVLTAVAVAVRITMGSPVLFRQQRPGKGGRRFTLYKFRTMRDAIGPDGAPLPDAERLTRLGRFLRSTSLDELPELVNVLNGDMSLVGPRPLLVEYLDRYTDTQARRHEVRPGITGWAQVNGRNATTWDDRLAMDVWYVDHRSLRLDLQILSRTMRAVLGREGISAEGHATMPFFEGTASDSREGAA